jgi:hypothetical protein
MQSILTFTWSPEGHSEVREIQAALHNGGAACREAAVTGVLKVGAAEHVATMNVTRSHMGGDEDCPQVCGHRVKTPDKKVTQILMEILVRKELIWWKEGGEDGHHLIRQSSPDPQGGPGDRGGRAVCVGGTVKSWRSGASCSLGRLWTSQLSQEQSPGECRSGGATPAVQRGSVLRMLLLGLNSLK